MAEQAGAARPGDDPGRTPDAFARRWAAALASTIPTAAVASLPPSRLEHLLAGFTADLRTALREDARDGHPSPARGVGRGLVEHGLDNAGTLERTLAVVGGAERKPRNPTHPGAPGGGGERG
ncbi:hypothetical protein AB0G02_02910, partial [Actinosynnema sp. NPDC023658]|uniref:hypothetical protein n=1 Tax=Actinosynnema sp. NPDC023658 TaxID=3155465 RepID=UPI0033CF9736